MKTIIGLGSVTVEGVQVLRGKKNSYSEGIYKKKEKTRTIIYFLKNQIQLRPRKIIVLIIGTKNFRESFFTFFVSLK